MALAEARGELISKRLAIQQASFLMGSMREKLLSCAAKLGWPLCRAVRR
jgi:hypothetical protein